MNAPHHRPLLRTLLLLLLGIYLCGILGSCAVFRARANRWEETVTRDPDGVLSHARARTWQGDGPSLLLVHGFADGPHVWNTLGPELAAAGFHVHAMRLPGWNEPLEVKRQVTREDWRNAVLQEVEILRQREQPVAVLAHSLGGCITADLVQSGSLSPDAVVLYAPLFRVSNARSPVLSSRTWFKIGNRLLPDSFIVESIFQEQSTRGTPRPPQERDPYNPKQIFVEIFGVIEERAERPLQSSCPVRLVVTTSDRVINTDAALEWLQQMDAPVKDLLEVSDAGHAMPLELDAVAETNRLLDWFDHIGIGL